MTADLNGEGRDFIVILHLKGTSVYRLVADSLEFFADLQVTVDPKPCRDVLIDQSWTIGDLNNDGRDEIIISKGNILRLYELKDNKLIESKYELPLPADQIVAGDVNNDGTDELVLFCHKGFPGFDWRVARHYIQIVRPKGKGLSVIWSDEGKLGYKLYEAMLPDRFHCIADIKNRGNNQLVISRMQSDVRSMTYDLFEWNGSSLTRTGSFKIAGGTLIESGRNNKEPFVSGPLMPLLTDRETVFLAPTFCKRYILRIYIAEIKDERLITFEPLFKTEPSDAVGWIDLGGGQRGVVRINPRPKEATRYMIFKL